MQLQNFLTTSPYITVFTGVRDNNTAPVNNTPAAADNNLQEWQDCSLIPGWQVRKCSNSLRLEFLAPDHRLVTSIAEAMVLMKNPPPTFATAADNGGTKSPPPEDAKVIPTSSSSTTTTSMFRPCPVLSVSACSSPLPTPSSLLLPLVDSSTSTKPCIANDDESTITDDNNANIKLNQVFVTTEWKELRQVASGFVNLPSANTADDSSSDSDSDIAVEINFTADPVVFVPKLTKLIQDEEIRARLEQMDGGEKISGSGANNPRKISVPLNMIHSDEGYENNVDELKTVMTRRQRDSYRKAKSAAIDKLSAVTEDLNKSQQEIEKEEEEKMAVNSDGRSRRNRQRQNYEEMNDEDFNSLLPKPKFLIQQLNTPPPVVTPLAPATVTSTNSAISATYGVNGRIPSMRVKERNRMTDQELALMEKWFTMNPYPTAEDRDLIAEMMDMPEKKVRVWFQNKRYKTEDGRMKCHFAKNAPPPPTPVNNTSADSCSSTTSLPAIANVTTSSNYAAEGVGGTLDIPATGTHVCQVCHQNFTTQTDYQIHCKRVHGTETERVVCKDCLKTFDTLWNLKTHCIEFHMGVG